MLHDLHFFILTCLHKIHSFSLAVSSEAIRIDELDFIVLKLHTYTTFFLLKLYPIRNYKWKLGIVSFLTSIYPEQ